MNEICHQLHFQSFLGLHVHVDLFGYAAMLDVYYFFIPNRRRDFFCFEYC